jgi:hypothetical protein
MKIKKIISIILIIIFGVVKTTPNIESDIQRNCSISKEFITRLMNNPRNYRKIMLNDEIIDCEEFLKKLNDRLDDKNKLNMMFSRMKKGCFKYHGGYYFLRCEEIKPNIHNFRKEICKVLLHCTIETEYGILYFYFYQKKPDEMNNSKYISLIDINFQKPPSCTNN